MQQQSEQRPTLRSLRRSTETLQAVLILGLPFLKINRESVLRFDLSALKLHFFGTTLWMHEFFLVLVATISLTLLALFVTLVFGRVWCGWFCPQTVLIDLTPFMDRAGKRGAGYRAASLAATFGVSAVVAASLSWYFQSPYEFLPALFGGTLGGTVWAIWGTLTAVLFLNFALLRHRWCATVCPYAKLQGVLYDQSTMLIELDARRSAECIDCRNCLRACPTGIDVRKGLDAACINCAECIDACDRVMARNGKQGLIGYALGPGGTGRVLRQSVIILGGLLLLFLALTLQLITDRTVVDVTVLPHRMGPRLTRDGRVVNAYVLAVKNKQERSLDLTVTVERFDETVLQSITDPIHVEANALGRFPLFIHIDQPAARTGTRLVKIRVDSREQDIHITREANFTVPNAI